MTGLRRFLAVHRGGRVNASGARETMAPAAIHELVAIKSTPVLSGKEIRVEFSDSRAAIFSAHRLLTLVISFSDQR